MALGPEAETHLRGWIANAKGEASSPVPIPSPVAAAPRVRTSEAVGVAKPAAAVEVPVRVRATAPERDPVPEPPVLELPKGDRAGRWAALRAHLEACPEARRRRAKSAPPLVGHGSLEPDVLFVGEHPDEHEEAGEGPFSGPAGELLSKALRAMGLAPDRVHVTHVVRWRPLLPSRLGSRPPTAREIAYCLPYLRAQVEILAPKVVVAMGGVSLNALADADSPLRITQERGVWREVLGVPLLPTYLPSYLLRNPSSKVKREFWEDLLSVMGRLGLPISERQRGFYR